MKCLQNLEPVQIGLVVAEPIRMEGLRTVFEAPPEAGCAPLLPVSGTIEELLAASSLSFLMVDLLSFPNGIATLETIRRVRPDLRLIVIGPQGNDDLVMDAIVAGARAYLDSAAGPHMVRKAIEVVTEGSIWAPRHLLSRLIDRLLKVPGAGRAGTPLHLTSREHQVLELILMARSNREIARHLGIEERTVKAHVGRLMRKTGTDNRIELSMRAINRSLLIPELSRDRRQGERRKAERRLAPSPTSTGHI